VEILPKSIDLIAGVCGSKLAAWIGVGSLFLGMIITALIDQLVPEHENPHEVRSHDDLDRLKSKSASSEEVRYPSSLMRTGVLTALAIGIHNFPEGLVTFLGALVDPSLGISIAVAVAIHNIPEGISVSVPIFYATGNKRKAFTYSFLSGLAEPLGGLIGYFVLRPFINDIVIGILFAVVAGIMVFISLDQLLPTAREYGKGHTAIAGLVLGMAVMALSLLLFQ